MTRATIDVSGLPSFAFGQRSILWWATLGMIAIEGMAFALTIAAYIFLRWRVPDWPPGNPPGPIWHIAVPALAAPAGRKLPRRARYLTVLGARHVYRPCARLVRLRAPSCSQCDSGDTKIGVGIVRSTVARRHVRLFPRHDQTGATLSGILGGSDRRAPSMTAAPTPSALGATG